MIEKRAYNKAELETIEVDSEEFLKGEYKEEAKNRILSIIDVEAPITKALLAKRLINSFGIKRLGSSLSDYFENVLIKELDEEGKLTIERREDDDIFHKGNDDCFFRPTPDDPDEVRYSYQIPVTEALNVITYILETTGRKYTKKALLEEFSKQLEYQRKGSQVVTLFNRAFEEGKQKGIIKKNSSGKFCL